MARKQHRKKLVVIPVLCAWLGFLVHLQSPTLFWSLLAYTAVFHFIKQHVGFALIYVRAGNESRSDRRLTTAAVWAGTLGPVVYWHAHLPTEITWFMQGDFLTGIPAWIGTYALALEVPVWLAFCARRIRLAARGRPNSLVVWLALIPAINWHLGIVLFDDDRIFTITNVFLHGIPYFALVWMAGGRDQSRGRLKKRTNAMFATISLFYGLPLVLAAVEETLWDACVWQQHLRLYGTWKFDLQNPLSSAIVAVLTVPQATHYILDRFIWRVGPDNPQLVAQLGLATAFRSDRT